MFFVGAASAGEPTVIKRRVLTAEARRTIFDLMAIP
jgi:hypothetical protein